MSQASIFRNVEVYMYILNTVFLNIKYTELRGALLCSIEEPTILSFLKQVSKKTDNLCCDLLGI